MSESLLIIEERAAQIAPGVMVGRLLPFRKKRMVAAFCFIDRMGPNQIKIKPGDGIGQHPHIGISTLTYLLAGSQIHTDSIGSRQKLEVGAVNWMTAGKGIVHNEASDPALAGKSQTMHGYQIWVALPKEFEEVAPSFFHAPKENLPRWEGQGAEFTLVAGEAMGHNSPVPVYSKLYLLDVSFTQTGVLSPRELYGEFGICVVEGEVTGPGQATARKGQMLIDNATDSAELQVAEGSRLLIFGGEPLPEKRYMDWNFVASDPERLTLAREAWIDREFDLIEGDDSYVPYPGTET